MTETAIDIKVLQELMDMFGDSDPEALTSVIDAYLEDSPSLIQQISTAIKQQTPKVLDNAAHTLKSTSATIGALNLSQMCRELEYLGKSNTVEGAAAIFSQLETEYEQVKMTLQRFIHKSLYSS